MQLFTKFVFIFHISSPSWMNSTEELPLFRVKVLSLTHVTLLTTFSTYFVDRGHVQVEQELYSGRCKENFLKLSNSIVFKDHDHDIALRYAAYEELLNIST